MATCGIWYDLCDEGVQGGDVTNLRRVARQRTAISCTMCTAYATPPCFLTLKHTNTSALKEMHPVVTQRMRTH